VKMPETAKHEQSGNCEDQPTIVFGFILLPLQRHSEALSRVFPFLPAGNAQARDHW